MSFMSNFDTFISIFINFQVLLPLLFYLLIVCIIYMFII